MQLVGFDSIQIDPHTCYENPFGVSRIQSHSDVRISRILSVNAIMCCQRVMSAPEDKLLQSTTSLSLNGRYTLQLRLNWKSGDRKIPLESSLFLARQTEVMGSLAWDSWRLYSLHLSCMHWAYGLGSET